MTGVRACLLLAVFSTLSLVALSSPDGDVQDLGEDVGRRGGGGTLVRRMTTSGMFKVARGGGHRRAGHQGNHEEDELGEASELSDAALDLGQVASAQVAAELADEAVARKFSPEGRAEMQRMFTKLAKHWEANQAQHCKAATTPTDDEDPGALARCESAGGKKQCPIGKRQAYVHKKWPKVRAASCPDGIGWQGFYYDHSQRGGLCLPWTGSDAATGTLRCEKHTCIDPKTGRDSPTRPQGKTGWRRYVRLCTKPGITPFKGFCHGKTNCNERPGARQVCQKMQVLHVNQMSRSAGVLIVKRSSCGADGKCSVFKAGLCIDLRRNVWSSTFNARYKYLSIADAKGGMIRQAKRFGRYARTLLKKYNNTLPESHACSDTRHEWKVQEKDRKGKPGKWRCFFGCKKLKDATLAQFAILNF